MNRDRHLSGLCQPCSLSSYYTLKPKKSEEFRKEYRRIYYQNNRKKLDLYRKQYGENLRLRVIEFLGNKCYTCQESDPVVLQIDHIYNDGNKERRLLRNFDSFAKRLFSGELDNSRYQILYCNCNWRKEYLRRKNAV